MGTQDANSVEIAMDLADDVSSWPSISAEVMRNPYGVRGWIVHLDSMKVSAFSSRRVVYERALRFLPRSYKLWHRYLEECESAVANRWLTSVRARTTVRTYERCLVHLNKMPRIWLRYLGVLRRLGETTRTRLGFDACLRALPITQHELVWPEYVEFAEASGCHQLGELVYRRYVMFDPNQREEMVQHLLQNDRKVEASRELAKCVEDPDFTSPSGKSRHQLYMKLIDVCASVGDECPLDVEKMIRAGLGRFTDEVGLLWCKLADFYIRSGRFESARDVYEEATRSVLTVRDFAVVFDAYTAFEESVITATMNLNEGDALDVDFRLARLEKLVATRPLLLSSVVLRQNPHNVNEWLARAKLFEDTPRRLRTLAEAVKTVDPRRAVGKPEQLWIELAVSYGDLTNARVVFERAIETEPQTWKSVEQLATIYCAWIELELRHEQFDAALNVAQRAVLEPERQRGRRKSGTHRSSRLWSLYIDLEESLGTFSTAKAAYERCLELKVASPQTVLNYAAFLSEHHYFEDSFKAYEKGLAMFKWPHAKDIWFGYLDAFLERYPTSKLERARDLFEQALASDPPSHERAKLFVRYAKFEENHASARKAIAIYERAAMQETSEPYRAYLLYATKVAALFGASKARPIYEVAIKRLEDDRDAKEMCLKLLDLEIKLGEIDRARAVLAHGAQFAPKDDNYWNTWRQFEISHGNEDTFRDMLRIKRSVETAHNVTTYHAVSNLAAGIQNSAEHEEPEQHPGTIRALEQEAEDIVRQATAKKPRLTDPNEIDLDDDDDDGEAPREDQVEVQLERRPVPDAVFGEIDVHATLEAAENQNASDSVPVGALARFQNQRATASAATYAA